MKQRNLDLCINSVDALQTGDQQMNSFIGLYKEIEFEVDLESLQTIVAAAELVNCVEKRLIVQFKKQQASGTAEASEYGLIEFQIHNEQHFFLGTECFATF